MMKDDLWFCVFFISDKDVYAIGNTVIAIYDFNGQSESELSFLKGDRLEIVDKG